MMLRRTLVTVAAALLFALAVPAGAAPAKDITPDELEQVFIVAAGKALERQDLSAWQREGYTEGMKSRRWAKVKQTVYCPPVFKRGQGTRWGRGCSERVLASNTLREGTYVFCVWHHGKQLLTQLRQVWDTGADWNDGAARRIGCDFWIDAWVPRVGWEGMSGTPARNVAVIEYPRASQSKHWRGKAKRMAQW